MSDATAGTDRSAKECEISRKTSARDLHAPIHKLELQAAILKALVRIGAIAFVVEQLSDNGMASGRCS